MLLYDATHTSHTLAQTGIQRVVRSLLTVLPSFHEVVEPICYDHFLGAWRALEADEQAVLHPPPGPVAKRRGAQWSLQKRLSGRTRRLLGRIPPVLSGEALLCPELFSPVVAQNQPALFARVSGPRVAVFHDAIALKFPELTPAKTVARFPAYLRELLRFDGIAAISEDSATSLRDYWAWLGEHDVPPVQAIPLGLDEICHSMDDPSHPLEPATCVVLSVGSIEGRKNHLALLEACESLWREGQKFELHLIGMAQPATAGLALEKLRALQAAGRPLRYDGPQSEPALHAAYRECAFTVYPSLIEGFGLPVLESLAHGKPCVCSGRGALGESSHGGGCVALDSVDAASLAAALRRLLQNPAMRQELTAAARRRVFRTWRDYASDLTAWMRLLKRRGRPADRHS